VDAYLTSAGGVLGRLGRTGSPRVHIARDASTARRWATALAAKRQPESVGIPVTVAGLGQLVTDPAAFAAFAAAASDFCSFLDHWTFVPPGQPPRLLGDDLWAAQATYTQVASEHPWVYFLKARQLGESTVATAYDGWVARFGQPNARVHIFCQRDQNAVELLEDVAYGLDALPAFMRLPLTATAHALTLDAGPKDTRTVRAYPANVAVRGASCVHAHVDEWAAMLDPKKVWAAVEPTIVPGGSCHVLTTGTGPVGYPADEWRKAIAGESRFHPCFVDALRRPDRTPAWYEGQRASMHPDDFAREYPLRWEDALSGGGSFYFAPDLIDLTAEYALGCQPPQKNHRYVTGWDVGIEDATVGVTLDVTGGILDVVNFVYLSPTTYGEIQWHIEDVARRYRGTTVVESNSMGAAVIANLYIPVTPFFTSAANKGRILAAVHRQLQIQCLKWNPSECPQLDSEMRGYRLKDEGIRQDAVMALSIAVEHASAAHDPHRDEGRLMPIILV
jgi:hypothetical protein